LAVALAALRISHRATNLEQSKTELQQRQWRHEQLPEMQAWLRGFAREPAEAPIWERIKPVRAHAALVQRLVARGDEDGVNMLAWLQWQVGAAEEETERMDAEMKGSVMIDDWAANPANVDLWIDKWNG
jgi:hypothetical protein